MMLDIRYGIESELEIIRNTLRNTGWLTTHGYRTILPRGTFHNCTPKQLRTKISKEIHETDYQNTENKIAHAFSQTSRRFTRELRKRFSIVPDIVIVYLTNYGVGGSYQPPNIITLNINNMMGINTLYHEIVHLVLKPLIKRFKITHWEEERTVDLILNSKEFKFLKYASWQRSYRGVGKYVDAVFNRLFRINPEAYFLNISRTRMS